MTAAARTCANPGEFAAALGERLGGTAGRAHLGKCERLISSAGASISRELTAGPAEGVVFGECERLVRSAGSSVSREVFEDGGLDNDVTNEPILGDEPAGAQEQ